ncbi:MAG TPA: TonB-dependent receptor [Ohtaekwangia sp.]|nr:TonB-dependent receptor [Ohtaekwangia sp.]
MGALLSSQGLQALNNPFVLSDFSDHPPKAINVSGQVVDEDGNSMPGVNVVVKGTTEGTTTDLNGEYSISVADGNVVLVFSFIGYQTAEVTVGTQTVINVTLTTDIQTLSEIVVVGYGTQKRSSVTGAIASVSSKELSTLPTTSIDQSLQGRAPGVTVTNNGAPGTAPVVRIRGVGTINNANPLYVVDGVPVGEGTNIDPKDVQSLEVLKDAFAAAIYGSRAANGVILITTKSATQEKLSVSIDSYIGVQSAWRKLDLLNRDQYIQYADALGDLPPRVQNGLDEPIYPGATRTFRQTDTDWQDEMFRNATIQQHRFEITKGGEVSKFYVSGSYFDQDGIMLGTEYKRGNVRMNSEHKISKRITFGQTLYLNYDRRRAEINGGSIGSNIRYVIASIPYLPVYNPDNVGGFFGPQAVDASDPTQPVRRAILDENYTTGNGIFATGYLNVKLMDWLTYRFHAGVNISNSINNNFSPSYSSGAGGYDNRGFANISETRSNSVSPTLTNQLTVNKSFGKHNLNVDIIAEKQSSRSSFITASGTNEITDAINIPRGVASPQTNGDIQEQVLISYIGRVNYDFNGKYLFGASFRRDGSSRFAPGNKWGNFPSVSAGWRISEEPFMQELSSAISELKVRGSYGFVGNNNIGNYAYQATLTNNTYYEFDRSSGVQTQGYTINAMANTELKWEEVEMLNVGIDAGLFGNKVNFSVEYFNNLTRDMILGRPIATSLGYDVAPTANAGSVRNKGIEWQLGYSAQEGEFKWSANANMGIIRNEVVSLGDKGNSFARENWYGDNLTLTRVGDPISFFYGYQVEKIFQTQEEINAADAIDGDPATKYQDNAAPGDIMFRDKNGDGVINADDKTKLGKYIPDFTYGFNFSANWKNFDATLFIQGVQGNQIYSTTKYHLEGMTRLFNAGTAVLDAWTTPGQSTSVPRAVSGDPNLNSRASDRFVEDGSYMRIKNLTLGYSLPSETLGAITNSSLTKLRIYLSATNLLTWTKYKSGYDPEIGAFNGNGANASFQNGIDYGQYPQPRTITVGVQIGL